MSSYTKARQRYESQTSAGDDDADAPPIAKCMANGCPMAAGLSLGGSRRGAQWCAYHHACHTDDLARVTSVLNQHAALRDIINEGRRFIGHANVDESAVPGEHKRLVELMRFAAYEPPKAHNLGAFIFACETMLGGFVVEAMRSIKRAA
jgi:hypothetical protein